MSGKFALIIGNTEYNDSGLAQLSAPGKDAEDFARILGDKEIGAFDNVNVLLNQSSSTVNEAIDEFFDQKKPDDLLVLYFSGHGVRDELGSLYLAVKNTIHTRLRSTAIKSDYIREVMDQSRSKRQVLILDCCNSGAFAQGTKAFTGGSIGTASAFEGGYGRIILTASDSTQFAWEGDQVIGETDNSLFTHYLIEGLKGEADIDGDGRITVDELYDYAYEKVRFATPKQTPSKFSSKQQGEIVLRQSTRIENIKPQPLSPELMDEIEDTRPYVREAAVQKLEKILKGRNIGQARSAHEALEKIVADENTSRRVAQLATQALTSFEQTSNPPDKDEKTKEETDRLSMQEKKRAVKKDLEATEEEARESQDKAELVRKNIEIPKHSREAAFTATQNFMSKLKVPVLVLLGVLFVAFIGYQFLQKTAPLPKKPSTNPTEIGTIIPTSTLEKNSIIGADGAILIYVPSGEFLMGSTNDDTFASSDQRPQHTVKLGAFWIDQTEVTNGMYAKCVNAGICAQPINTDHFNNSSYIKHPVVYVDWNKANAYCSWAGRRLPTEAEWEKAARGTEAFTYPWGEGIDCHKTNYEGCAGDTSPVISGHESGKSPYDVYDMAGNVWEWVNDWYSGTYYQSSPAYNPSGPNTGQYRVLRGGSWFNGGTDARSADRYRVTPENVGNNIGFRCARSP